MRFTWFRNLKHNEEGSAALEFAIIGVPFVLLVVGVLEIALMFTSQSLLEASTAEAARRVRTGAIQQGGGEDEFKDTLCEYADTLMLCEELQYQVMSMDSFDEAENFPPASFDEDGNLENQEFEAGGVSDVVMIRVAYRYKIKTPMMQIMLTNNGDGNRILLSTVVLQTEPYEFEDEDL